MICVIFAAISIGCIDGSKDYTKSSLLMSTTTQPSTSTGESSEQKTTTENETNRVSFVNCSMVCASSIMNMGTFKISGCSMTCEHQTPCNAKIADTLNFIANSSGGSHYNQNVGFQDNKGQ